MSPSGSQHSVIQLRSRAVWLVVNSASVELEGRVRSINGNTCWSQVNLGLKIVLITSINVDVRSERGTRVLGVVDTSSVLCSVWVACLGINSLVVNDILHGLGHESSVASLVALAVRAINEILLRQANELLLSYEVASLSRSSSGESPAGTTLLLVLDGGNSSMLIPVPGGRKSLWKSVSFIYSCSRSSVSGSKVESGKLRSSKIGELVEANLEGLIGSVVAVDEVQVVTEGSVSVKELVMMVALLVLLHPEGESGLVLRLC